MDDKLQIKALKENLCYRFSEAIKVLTCKEHAAIMDFYNFLKQEFAKNENYQEFILNLYTYIDNKESSVCGDCKRGLIIVRRQIDEFINGKQ